MRDEADRGVSEDRGPGPAAPAAHARGEARDPALAEPRLLQPIPAIGRGRIGLEIAIVLGLGLGRSAVYSIVQLADALTRPEPIGQQTTTLNPSQSSREVFDLIYQLLGITFSLVPVLLVGYLLWSRSRPHLGRLGIVRQGVGIDLLRGIGLLAVIGVAGLAIYLGGRALGIGLAVDPSGLSSYWWTVPVLLLSAVRASVQEEVVMIGYLFARLGDLRWNRWAIILGSALVRGSYHLYQGFGAFVANALMGALFGWLYTRWGRVLPFLVAHFLIDAIVFVGYPLAAAAWPALFGLPVAP
ncbi:MAG: CPBP family intramembrane metalloprotease [Actinomycetales bacterium]|nr:CPBP family intramembrane metalloprotease [Actinomycetales bacterium]